MQKNKTKKEQKKNKNQKKNRAENGLLGNISTTMVTMGRYDSSGFWP